MSQLGKIFLWIAFAGLLASLGAGYFLITQKNDINTKLATESQSKASAVQEAAKQKALAQAAALAQADAEKKLADQKATVDDLNTQLKTANDKADTAAKALTQAQTDGAQAASDLAAIKKDLNGKSVADILAAESKAEADLQSNLSEQKILTDQVQAAQGQIDQLKKDINASKIPFIPPGVSGKVTFVNRTWNFVVLDVGLSNGVVPNGQLIVYRKNAFLGKVKITTADANSSVADILPDAKGDIQVGDYVLN